MLDDYEKAILGQEDEREEQSFDHLKDALKSVAGTRQGRRLLYAILVQSGYKQSGFNLDPYAHAFNAGQRNIGLWLEGLLAAHCPEVEALLIREAKEDLENDGHEQPNA